MKFLKSKIMRKITIIGFSLIVILAGFTVINKKTHLYPEIDKMMGEVAGIALSGKFLDSIPDVLPVSAQTSSPYQDVLGDVAISGNLRTSVAYRSLRSDGDIYLQAVGVNDDVFIGDETGARMVLKGGGSGGKVGIGTAGPATRLNVANTSAGSGSPLSLASLTATTRNSDGDTSGPALAFHTSIFGYNSRIAQIASFWDEGWADGGALGFYTRAGDNTFSGTVSERMRITSTGNVGIGTASPGYQLDVNGAINATSVLINGVAVGAGGTQWASGAGGVISYTGGNVGIGTASPREQFQIGQRLALGAFTSEAGQVTRANIGNNLYYGGSPNAWRRIEAGKGLQWQLDEDAFGIWGTDTSGTADSQVTDGAYKLQIQSGGNVIINAGNVGIGTASPTIAKLVVKGADDASALSWTNASDVLMGQLYTTGGTTAGGLRLFNAAGTETIRISGYAENSYFNAGNVGIGTANPGYPLTVNGTISLGSSNLNSTTPRFIIYDDGWNANYITYGADAITRMKTTNSFYIMGVPTGANRLSDAGTVWGSIYNTAGWQAGSSRTIKHNITPLTDGDFANIATEFRNNTMYSYIRNDDTNNMLEYGVIAEEAPLMVLGGPERKNVSPTRWLGALTSYVKYLDNLFSEQIASLSKQLADLFNYFKEQQAQIKALQAENAELRLKLDSLELRLRALEDKTR